MYLKVSASILNHFDFPKEYAAFNRELMDISADLENGFLGDSPGDAFFADAFSDFVEVDEWKIDNEIERWMLELSESYPSLIFYIDTMHLGSEEIVDRIFYRNGKVCETSRQLVDGEWVIPDPVF